MDQNGVMPGVANLPIFSGLIEQATNDYKRLSPTPNDFSAFSDAMFKMLTTQPNYTAADLAKIKGPAIAIADGDHEEIIKRDYAAYLAHNIPGARLIILPGVSHFAPVQNPSLFNAAMVGFLNPVVK
jgi:pimeloyl-ACP methyl ester carboxylesterase